MKKLILSILFMFVLTSIGLSQVAINETGAEADSSAILDLSSTNKGFLVPRMTTTQRNAISTAQSALMVYDTDSESFWYWDNSQTDWVEIKAGDALNINSLTDGSSDGSSVFLGDSAGSADDGNNINIAIGIKALKNNTSGRGNIAIGNAALEKSNYRSHLVAIGDSALYNNGTSGNSTRYGVFNTALGAKSMFSNTIGSSNTAIGRFSLYRNISGEENTSTGNNSLLNNKTGKGNTANGFSALYSSTSGNSNTAIGRSSMYGNKNGFKNTAVGAYSLFYNSSGDYNTALGVASLYNNLTADYNVAIGLRSLYYDTTGSYNVALGSYSLHNNQNGEYNTATGYGSMNSGTTAHSNVAMGVYSLYNNTNRSNLVAIGDSALFNNGTGVSYILQATANTAVGSKSLYANTTGYQNTAIGFESLLGNTTAEDNTAIGYFSLHNNTTGGKNVAIGSNSMDNNTTGIWNTSIGTLSARNNDSGSYNTNIGYLANAFNISGNNNTAVGMQAGMGVYGNSIGGCVFLGYQAGKNNSNSNKLYIDNSDTTAPLIGGDFSDNRVDINGTVKITGGSPGNAKVLTSDYYGNATWETSVNEFGDLSDAKHYTTSYFLGYEAGLYAGNTNNNNLGLGDHALHWSNGGSENIAIGNYAQYLNVGDGNIAIGLKSMYNNRSGYHNTIIGSEAGYGIGGYTYSGCVLIGYQAGKNNYMYNSLYIDNSDTSAPLIGGSFYYDRVDINGTIKITGGSPGAGKVLTSDTAGLASWETPAAYASKLDDLTDAITDGSSIFVGDQVGTNDDGTNYNTALGDEAFKTNSSGQHNTAFGYKALENSNGENNSAFGLNSLRYNTSGSYNTAFGRSAVSFNQTGSNNTALGYSAGLGSSGNNYSGCVFIGFEAGKNNSSNNKLFIDNSSTSTPLIGGDFDTDQLHFNASKVGIGTNNPNELLEVASNSSGNRARMIVSNGDGASRKVILFVSPSDTYNYARIDTYDYDGGTGMSLKINTVGNGNIISGGSIIPETHISKDLGANGTAWNNVYAHNYVTQGSAAFSDFSVTSQIIDFPPRAKEEGAFDEFTEKGLKELDPSSLPTELTTGNALLIDEMTTYNYKANYEQQQQLELLKKENAELKARLERLEKLLIEK